MQKNLNNKIFGKGYMAFSNEQKGVMIYINDTHLTVIEELNDPVGRYVFLKMRSPEDKVFTLASTYVDFSLQIL